MSIASLGLSIKSEKPKTSSMENIECIDVNSDQIKMDMLKGGEDVNEKVNYMTGHDLNDQRLIPMDKQHLSFFQSQLRTIQKFDGNGDAEQWLKYILEKFDSFQLTSVERNKVVPDILTGEAIIWYAKHEEDISSFTSFMKKFLQYYGLKMISQDEQKPGTPPLTQPKIQDKFEGKETIVDSLRNQMLLNNVEKLSKFSGKSKQNVSKWLREFQQAMHICKLNDEEKLTYVSSWLEAEARDWFLDNIHLFSTWTIFVEKLLKTFESTGRSDISFNRLRHYEQGINQDVRQFYFEIMKLCKEANPNMDEASKLQYLKDGLKPSLRFDILLKDPITPEEFLQYAQKVEELKSLDEKQNNTDGSMENNFIPPLMHNKKKKNPNVQQVNSSNPYPSAEYGNAYYEANYSNNDLPQQVTNTTQNPGQYNYGIPKPPYRCYKCGGTDHFIRNCPHFQ